MELTHALHKFFSEFHFLHVYCLAALPVAWILAGWLARRSRQNGNWSELIDPELLPSLRLQSAAKARSPWALIALAWTLAILALSGPSWQHEQSHAFRARANWVMLLDLSPSMAAADLSPDRATRARYALDDLLDAARDARVALIAFAGEAHTVAPLTEDIATIHALLPPLAPDLMPEHGDAAAPALGKAAALLHAAGTKKGEIILLSDGTSDAAAAFSAAQEMARQGIRVNVVGIGTPAGAPLPDGKGSFVRTAQGGTALTRLQTDQLQRIARLGGGMYVPLDHLQQLIGHLQADTSHALATSGQQVKDRTVVHWHNGGFWLLLPLLLVCTLLARRGWL